MSPSHPALNVVRVGAGDGVTDLLSARALQVLAGAAVVAADPGLEPLARRLSPRARLVAPSELPPAAPTGVAAVRLVWGDGVAPVPGEPAPGDVVVGPAAGAEAAALATVADPVRARPLRGLRVVVTRAEHQAEDLAVPLLRAGAEVVVVPTIAIADPSDGGAGLDAAVGSLRADPAGRPQWLVVTSVNGARRVLARIPDARALAGVKLAAIGPATAAALAAAHLPPDLVPPKFVAESLLEVFPAPPPAGGDVLVARAEVARNTLPEGLAAAGWTVSVVAAYRTVAAAPPAAALAQLAGAHAICFTSPSTFERFAALPGAALPAVVASIGPVTSAALTSAGVPVAVEAAEHTVSGLVAALVDAAQAGRLNVALAGRPGSGGSPQ
jgi:uroporphyrinogen III methyltransferase/synthase